MAIQIESPFDMFNGLDGKPLSNGKIYIGQVGTDPTVIANQIPVFWDEAMTIPAAQPLTTNAGYIVTVPSGAPSRVYTATDYSMSVRNASNILVYYIAQFGAIDYASEADLSALSGALQLADYDALRAYTGARNAVYVAGVGIAGVFLRVSTGTDNGGTIIVSSNGAVWSRAYSGVIDVRWWGAKCDGVIDDKAAIQTAHDYIVSTGRKGVLTLPAGVVCKCNSPLTLNVSFVHFDLNSSQLDFSGLVGPITAITFTGNGTGTPYSQALNGMSRGEIFGPGGSSLDVDAFYFSTLTEAGTAQIMLNAVVVHGFHVGHTFLSNAYCINFYGCSIYNCGTATTQPSGIVNAGERITYSGCTIFNCGEGVDMQNGNGEFHFVNCSFDYNAGQFFIDGGSVVLTDCHVEGNSYLQPPIRVGPSNGSTLSWKGGEFLCTGANTVPLVSCQVTALRGGGVFIDGVFEHSLGTSAYFATGPGLVKNQNVISYDTSTLPSMLSASLPLFIDGSFEDASLPDVFITADTAAITNRLTGADIVLSSSSTNPRTGTKSLRAAKNFGAGSAASFIAVAPLKIGGNFTGVRGWYSKIGSQTGDMFIAHWFLALRDDKLTPAILRSAQGGQRTVSFSAATVPYTEFVISFESGRAPLWATHVGISVNMAGLGVGDVFFDDFEATEF